MARFISNLLGTILCYSLATLSPALAAEKKVFSGEVAAKYTKTFIDNHKSVGEFLKGSEPYFGKKPMDNLKRSLTSLGVDMKKKIPGMKVEGNKVYFDKNNYLIYEDAKTININGVKFSKDKEAVDVVFNKIYKKLSKKNASRFDLIPEAHAFPWLIALLALVGGVGLGAMMFHGKGNSQQQDAGTIDDYAPGDVYAEAGDTSGGARPKMGMVACSPAGKGYVAQENRNGRWIFSDAAHTSYNTVKVKLDQVTRACIDELRPCSKESLSRVKQAIQDPSWKGDCPQVPPNLSRIKPGSVDDAPPPADEYTPPPADTTPIVDEGQADVPSDDLPIIDDAGGGLNP